ncbi:MAG: hypothetical protein LBT42_09680, partial [Tannerella sp.]|nr:hypothetical protein [Tannerella sp.]
YVEAKSKAPALPNLQSGSFAFNTTKSGDSSPNAGLTDIAAMTDTLPSCRPERSGVETSRVSLNRCPDAIAKDKNKRQYSQPAR